MAAPREIELKLELDPLRAAGARRQIRRLPDLRAEGETRRLVSAIFDSGDHALRRGGLVLRIRRDGESRIQTLKAAGAGMLIERSEWESEVGRDEPDPALIPDPALRARVEAAGSLAPVLETDFERTLWHVRRQGSDVEVALDLGRIRAGGREVPIGEIELELKSGSAAVLFALGREIVSAVPARLGLQSKSERGYALLDAAQPAKAEPFLVGRKMRAGAAFQAIVRTCLRHYCLNEPGILARQVEPLHKARVAIRRLRSCWKLHKALLADAEGARLGRELRALSRSLGTARNLDVHLERIAAEGAPDELRAAIAADRERAYDRLARQLRSKRNRLLLLDVMAYAETGAWLRDPARRRARERKVSSFATKILRRRWKKLRKAGRDLAGQTPQARHRVRIDGKVLRYAAEFFAGAFAGRKADGRRRKMLEALAEMQTHLGDLNDIETAAAYEAAFRGSGGMPGQDARKAALLASAQAAHDRIARGEPFWR